MTGAGKGNYTESEEVRWGKFYEKLEKEIPRQFFEIFFNDIRPLEWNDERLIITSADEKILSHVKNRYYKIITSFAREVSNREIRVQFKVSEKTNAPVQENPKNEKQLNIFSEKHVEAPRLSPADNAKSYINKNYTFERFVKGPSNEYAYMAALGAAQAPKKFHNPLYLFGGVGLGKTHLMMAIANSVNQNFPWMKVLYVPSEAFQSDILEALQTKSKAGYQEKYRSADILLIDDIQFISERAEYTQEQIFHTFNHLYQHNKQIIISGDRPPQQLAMLKDRLISRFQSGLIVDIKPPNLETREAILISKSNEINFDVPRDVVRFIATHEKSQVRLLEAALIKLKFSCQITNKKVDLDLARQVLQELSVEQKADISIEDIVREVSINMAVRNEDILGKSRVEKIVLARHLAMYLARKAIPEMTLLNIANAFARNDHTTVLNAEKNIKMKMDSDAIFMENIKQLLNIITTQKKI
ncbi:MAG: chromosomal replication initiator protein DnaA [Spirochaetia bacterium]|nr:chromosomal replication initiator protein DnaA [Spirochaetia bacterium]